MPEVVWYRSLYWRIASGFVALLASLLVIQAAVFIWLAVIVGRATLGPAQLANWVAGDLSAALAEAPGLDVQEFVERRFGRIYQPFLVVLHDGRTAAHEDDGLPPGFRGLARLAYQRGRRADPAQPRRGTGRPPRRSVEVAAITPATAAGEVGFVAVPGTPTPPSVVLRRLGPTLGLVAIGLLVGGSAVMALLIFRPAHTRLRTLEQAATALGEGRTDVRAAETGGDEVTSLARAFNRMADDLSARESALIASDKARRQLLADVSHELMTPLAAIRGYTETLAMPDLALDDETRQRYLEIVEEETRKLEAMIGDLLDLARLEGGGGTLERERVRVSDLFQRVVDRHGHVVRDSQVRIRVNVAPPDLELLGDPNRLEQALQNLASNALRHTPPGGSVELSAHVENGHALLVVRDSGPGIPPEHLPHVFDRFYKADPARATTRHPSGSGLGLSIVKAIVERHGGSVTAANAPDTGAVFEMRLGCAQPAAAAAVSVVSEPRQVASGLSISSAPPPRRSSGRRSG